MAGVATESAKGAIQLTFPSIFSEFYAKSGRKYAPPKMERSSHHPESGYVDPESSFQKVQKERREDAERMVLAKVKSTKNSQIRFATTPNGMGFQPEPVLGQRKYANPMLGALILSSARQDSPNAPFHLVEGGMSGGVIRTKQGMNYVKEILRKRIDDLNAIDKSHENFAYHEQRGADTQEMGTTDVGEINVGQELADKSPMIEMNLILQRILDSVSNVYGEADAEFENEEGVYDDFGGRALAGSTTDVALRFLKLFFRYAPKMTVDELEDKYHLISIIYQQLEGLLDKKQVDRHSGLYEPQIEIFRTLENLFEKLMEYAKDAIGAVNRSFKERQQVSTASVKRLKFDRVIDKVKSNTKSYPETNIKTSQNLPPPRSDGRDLLSVDNRDVSESFNHLVAPYEAPLPAIQTEAQPDFETDTINSFGRIFTARPHTPAVAKTEAPAAPAAPPKKKRGRPPKAKPIGAGRTKAPTKLIKSHFNKAINGYDVSMR